MDKSIYTQNELYAPYEKKVYNGKHTQAAFLLGGIGTGNISVGSRGELRDWEIFNSPGKGNTSNYSFFSIWTKKEGEKQQAKVLESKLQPPYLNSSIGYSAEKYAGLPRFKNSKMSSEYPFVQVELEDESMPVDVTMEAFTPFIPLNPDDSGIPGTIIRYRVKNTSDKPMDVAVAGNLSNMTGFINNSLWGFFDRIGEAYNEKRTTDGIQGIFMGCNGFEEFSVKNGNLSLMTREKNVTLKPNWYDGAWWDGIHEFWDDFYEDGQLNEDVQKIGKDEYQMIGHKTNKIGSISVKKHLEPNEEQVFEFIMTWYMPNRPSQWTMDVYKFDPEDERTIKNHYASQFSDSWDAGEYLIKNMDRLENTSRQFTEALYATTLPSQVIEAIANNITVIRSNTCFRVEGGHFMAWEGCHDQGGSCHGTCTHVWNYGHTLAFLFPTLEQSARNTEFNIETNDEGKMTFRTSKLFAMPQVDADKMHPAADGQLGTLIRLYREWKLSGDNEFLKSVWDKAKLTLDYAFVHWDKDGDFVLDSQQHNTYDIEFYGPNALVNSLFYGALKAGAEMAEYMGDMTRKEKYQKAFEEGNLRMDSILWDEDYYIQQIDDVNEYKYQYGKGCLSDQLFGQTLAHVAGLGYVLPKEHVKKAVKSVFDNNFKSTMRDHMNVQRTYALEDEAGLLLCTWPKGGRPKIPFVYSDEVWSGIEYHVATHLIYEGFIDEGLTITKACRDRYDGIKRNPWSDIECGHHYARSLASWGLLIALSGFTYDMTKNQMDFSPKMNESNFKTFWSTGKAWGTYTQTVNEQGEIVKDVQTLYSR